MVTMTISRNSFLLTLLLALLIQCASSNKILKKAIKESGNDPDVTAVYQVAHGWYGADGTRADAVEVFHHLADSENHILSSAKLGHHYADGGNAQMAIKYFAYAGENGPHHASLYNAGRLLAVQEDWVGTLAYLKAAATLSQSYTPEYISDETTQSATEAYATVSKQVSREKLTVYQVADVFLFGSLQDLSEEAQSLWSQAVTGLVKFVQTLVDTNGQSQDEDAMTEVTRALRALWETYGTAGSLSELQAYLLLDNINAMLAPLAGLDEAYVPMAAGYAEALATVSAYCWEQVSVVEDDSACFNVAAASAISFYQRVGDGESVKRVLHAAQQHPQAAPHWELMEQTDPVRGEL
jgi:tetratricopeptide (TPR) repeat protein